MITNILIFCGGFGTRFNNGKPGKLKPLIKINKKEILIHIFELFKNEKVNFYLLGGYKFNELKKFTKKLNKKNIFVIDTGIGTPTGGRLLSAKKYIPNTNFILTYGDSLANFNLKKSLKLKNKKNFIINIHKSKFNYGTVKIKNGLIKNFKEKKIINFINAGFYVLDTEIFSYIKSKQESFEDDILPRIIKSSKKVIKANFVTKWQPIDDIYDKLKVETILKKNNSFFKN